jgi:uncharacterized membrane protein
VSRRAGIDWLRGIAVLIMIEAHTLDAWTRAAERTRADYKWSIVLGGMGAPLFLFLAGVTLALAAGARERKGLSPRAVAATAVRRGWQIFGFAFLFRLQSWVLSGGRFPAALFKVDILNIMGLAMVAAALLWRVGRCRAERAWLLGGAAALVAMTAPLVRTSQLADRLPAFLAWYLAPVPGFSTFTLFPWAGFLLAGAAIGLWLDAASAAVSERRAAPVLAVAGLAIAVGGYGASYLPRIYEASTFWGTSPTFFFVRLGSLIALLAFAFWWTAWWPGHSPLTEFGAASFFVYWIHVEMAYGLVSRGIHRSLTFEQTLAASAAFGVFLFVLVRLKNRFLVD